MRNKNILGFFIPLFQFVLELCQNKSTANLLNIQPHLKIIKDLKMSADCNQEVGIINLF